MSHAAVALLVLLLPLAALGQDTTGKQVDHAPGYTFGSNVEGYLRLSSDVCDIKSTIGTTANPDYAGARKIYIDGKNSKKSDGSIRTLRELATKSYAGEPIFDLYARYFKTAAFMDQPISFAFAGDAPYKTIGQRNETIVKGIEIQLQTLYLLHELDEAVELMKANKTSADKGAPHNVDETWAIFSGLTPGCSLWGSANRRGAEFGTMLDCKTSRVSSAITAAHRKLYEAAAAGDIQAFEAAQQEVIRQFIITYIQATLKYAELMDRASAKNDLETMQTEQAEGAMFFRTIEPFIARADNNSAATVQRVMAPGNPIPPNALAIVQPALERTYPKLGIDKSEVGTYGSKQSLGCPTSSAGMGSLSLSGQILLAAIAVLWCLVL